MARATLMWLAEPSDLHSTSWTPASSRMTRAAPPAMTPVPGDAGLIITRPPPVRPRTGWMMVLPAIGTVEQVALGFLGALLDREGHLLGLAVAETDPTVAVTDHHERGERETTTALDDLGDAVDRDDARLAQAARDRRHAVAPTVTVVAATAGCYRPGNAIRTPVLLHVQRTPRRRCGRGRRIRHGRTRPCRYRRPWPARRRADRPWWRRRRCGPSRRRAGRLRWSRRRRGWRPASSSITCTDRCLFERNTARRGRAAVPWIFLRTRRWRRMRPLRRACGDLAS